MSDTQSASALLHSENGNSGDDSHLLDHWLAGQDDEFGKGIHGVVYSCRGDSSTVLKEILGDQLSTPVFETLLERLRVLANLKHPNIVDHHGVRATDICIYLKMRRYSTSLDTMCRSYRRSKQAFPQELIIPIIQQVARGLAYIHEYHRSNDGGQSASPFVHGNLKPTNILANEDKSEFIISDAGLYGAALEGLNPTSARPQAYMSPEAILCEQYLPASDMWSLGAILYELTTGTSVPFLKNNIPADVFVDGWVPDLREVKNLVFKAILEHIFVLDPSSRLTATELLELLHEDTPPVCVMYMLRTRRLEHDLKECKLQISSLIRDNVELSGKLAKLSAPLETKVMPDGAVEASSEISAASKETVAQQDQSRPPLPPKLKPNELTKLMVAARGDNIDAAKPLINDGVGIRSADSLGMTALMHAARTQSLNVMKMLIGLENRMQDYEGRTALIYAAIDGRLAAVKCLIEYEGKMCDKNGTTALMHAVLYGHNKIVKALKSVECKLQDKEGQTALMHAADTNNHTIINILARDEAAIKDHKGRTAFMHALHRGHKDAAAILLRYDDPTDSIGRTALMRAADENKVDIIPFLIPIQKGFRTHDEEDIESYTVTNRTALMGAAIHNNLDAIKLLVEHEAGIQDSNGYTALMFAAKSAHYEAVEILLPHEKGIKNNYGQTAAILAEEFNLTEIINLMEPYEEERDSLKGY